MASYITFNRKQSIHTIIRERESFNPLDKFHITFTFKAYPMFTFTRQIIILTNCSEKNRVFPHVISSHQG